MTPAREKVESAGDRCFACSQLILTQDQAVYLYGAWFHHPCYQRENNFPADRTAVRRAIRPVKRLLEWIAEETPSRPPCPKDAAAVELGRRGGLKGGRARAARLSPAQRAAIARRAARARWGAAKEH